VLAVVLIWVLCLLLGGLTKPTIGNLIPYPPPGGCPPAISTAIAFGGEGEVRYWAEMGMLPDGLPLAQQTALVRGDYEGCP
jgi:hypothetical protein